MFVFPLSKASRTVVLGIDAMDLRLVKRWAAEGALPFLAGLLDRCPLVSLSTPSRVLQGAVWPSLLTGVSPGRHGLYLQSQLRTGSYDVTSIRDLRCGPSAGEPRKFYDYLGAAGLRCGVADIPMDAPAQNFPGLQIVEWATEFVFWGCAAQPPQLAHDVQRAVGAYPIAPERNSGDAPADHRRLLELLRQGIERKAALVRYLLAHDDLNLVFAVFMEAHKAGHWLWKYWDETHPDHDASDPVLVDGLRACYTDIDRALAALAATLTPNDNLIIVSDHGMQANFRGNHLAESILERMGLLVRKGRRPLGADVRARTAKTTVNASRQSTNSLDAVRRLIPQWAKPPLRELFGLPRIDWRGTRAFLLPTDRNTHIRVNLKGREPNGTVAPGAAYEQLLNDLEAQLCALTNVTTGQPAVREVFRVQSLYPGAFAAGLPDLAVLWAADAPIDGVESARLGVIYEPVRELRSGNHREEGFLLARGPAFIDGPGQYSGDILQIAPTLLALHGVDRPDQFEREPVSILRDGPRR